MLDARGGLIGWEVETKVSLLWTEGKITGEEGRQKMSHIHQEILQCGRG